MLVFTLKLQEQSTLAATTDLKGYISAKVMQVRNIFGQLYMKLKEDHFFYEAITFQSNFVVLKK